MGFSFQLYIFFDKVIYSVKHNVYIKSLVRSWQHISVLVNHGAFSECLCIKNWPEDGSLEPKHVAIYVLINIYIYICCV